MASEAGTHILGFSSIKQLNTTTMDFLYQTACNLSEGVRLGSVRREMKSRMVCKSSESLA
jgi:hypothetical protein